MEIGSLVVRLIPVLAAMALATVIELLNAL